MKETSEPATRGVLEKWDVLYYKEFCAIHKKTPVPEPLS